MRKPITLLLLFVLLMPSVANNWQLVFEDTFDTDGSPDPAKWSHSVRYSSDWNRYLNPGSDNAFVKEGKLVLRAFPNPDQTADPVPYHTGGIETNGRFALRYGKVEVCAKLCKGKGSWPAIWLMPQSSTFPWPDCGEIDIMEHLNYDNFFYTAIHNNWYNNLNQYSPSRSTTCWGTLTDFNVYGMEWHEDRIDFLFNDNIYFSYPKLTTQAAIDGYQWPFNQEFYLILNQAAGGSWVGWINDADMPFQMEVDWVRMYSPTALSVEETATTAPVVVVAKDNLHISGIQPGTTLLLCNLLGVAQPLLTLHNTTQEVSLAHLPTGVYTVTLSDGTRQYTHKVIK